MLKDRLAGILDHPYNKEIKLQKSLPCQNAQNRDRRAPKTHALSNRSITQEVYIVVRKAESHAEYRPRLFDVSFNIRDCDVCVPLLLTTGQGAMAAGICKAAL